MHMHRIDKAASSLTLLSVFLATACGVENPLTEPTAAQAQPQSSVQEQSPTLAPAQAVAPPQEAEATPEAPVITPVTPAEPSAALPDPFSLPRADIDDFKFIGGFRLPAKDYGDTSLNYAKGVIEQTDDSLFIVGHQHHDMIAEFPIPELINSEVISELVIADDPIQLPVSILGAASSGNTQGIDEITGLEVIDDQLIVNAMEYYDAPADNSHTTLIVDNAFELATANVGGYYEMQGAAHAGGWLSPIPTEWQAILGGDYLTGHSSGEPIISRLSVGPSAFVVTSSDLSQANAGDPEIKTATLLDFSLERPLHEDLFNESGENDLWTHTSRAVYGFIVPGTRTYATFGHTSGITSGIGYKITQDDGSLCPGYCSYLKSDQMNFYWLWDVSDLVAVKDGQLAASSVRPYAHGTFEVPYQTSDTVNRIGGASFDEASGILLFSVLKADNEQGEYANPPIIAGYRLNLQ